MGITGLNSVTMVNNQSVAVTESAEFAEFNSSLGNRIDRIPNFSVKVDSGMEVAETLVDFYTIQCVPELNLCRKRDSLGWQDSNFRIRGIGYKTIAGWSQNTG